MQCEIMARLVCDSSLLKAHHVNSRGTSHASRMCDKCDLGIEERARHIIMQCPFFEEDKKALLDELNDVKDTDITELLRDHSGIFLYLMGKQPEGVCFEAMYIFWTIAAKHITEIYKKAKFNR